VSLLVDEQISFRVARALKALGEPVDHVMDVSELGRGTKDHVLLPYCGRHDLSLVTLDRKMKTTPQLHALMNEFDVGVFFVYSGSKKSPDPWQIFSTLVKHWREVLKVADSQPKPFSKLLKPNGGMKDYHWVRRARRRRSTS
jgi:hypothetical protein